MSSNCKQATQMPFDLNIPLELTPAERVAAIGAVCRRIMSHLGTASDVSAAAWQFLREMPYPTDSSLQQLLQALGNRSQ